MKKYLFLLIFTVLSALTTTAQNIEVPQTHTPLIVKNTATWCPNCGSWGWTFFHNLIEDNEEKAVLFAAHPSGKLKNKVSSDIKDNFHLVGQPRFAFNGEDQYVGSNSTSEKRNSFATKVDEYIAEAPVAQTGIEATYNNNEMKVAYKTTFFSSVSGEYYLGLYLVEKEVIAYQAAVGDNAKHKKVLRLELTGNSFGNLIASGSIDANESFEGNISFDISKYNVENLEIVSVLWKKADNDYNVINSNIDKEVSYKATNGVKDKYANSGIIIYPTIVKNIVNIELDLDQNNSSRNLSLYDLNGRLIENIGLNSRSKGMNKIIYHIPSNLKNGFYFIDISDIKGNKITKKIILER